MTVPAYVIARLEDVALGPDIVEYLERIDQTLAPFGGRFLIHGSPAQVLEGQWPGDTIMLGFPDLARAEEWYASAAYQQILPLRTDNSAGHVILVEGVPTDHVATDILND